MRTSVLPGMFCVCVCLRTHCTDLWDNGDLGTELVEPQLGHVHAIDEDVALRCLDDAEQAQSERRLPGSGAAHDPDLHIHTAIVEEHLPVSQITCRNQTAATKPWWTSRPSLLPGR